MKLFLWFAAVLPGIVKASSNITISTFTDEKCNVASTKNPTVSIPLDACIVTVGMGSLVFPKIPCAGGGLPSAQFWAYSDESCVKQWDISWVSYGDGCYGAIKTGDVFGAIMASCNDYGMDPKTDGTKVVVDIGNVARSSTSNSGSNGTSTSDDSSSKPTSSSDSSAGCSGFSCLSNGERIGVIVALSMGIPPILYGLYRIMSGK